MANSFLLPSWRHKVIQGTSKGSFHALVSTIVKLIFVSFFGILLFAIVKANKRKYHKILKSNISQSEEGDSNAVFSFRIISWHELELTADVRVELRELQFVQEECEFISEQYCRCLMHQVAVGRQQQQQNKKAQNCLQQMSSHNAKHNHIEYTMCLPLRLLFLLFFAHNIVAHHLGWCSWICRSLQRNENE